MFSTQRDFNEDWLNSYVEKKRKIGAIGDGVELFFQDCEGSDPDGKIGELKEFTAGVSLEDLQRGTGSAGQRQGAWIDERSYPNRRINSQTREHKNPACAAQLYQRLKIPVRVIC